MTGRADRYARRHQGGGAEDQREASQRDRDRIIHSSALRRLGGVTQVVDPAEGYVFHNRLTHTLKVAQIARRLAEKLREEQQEASEAWGGIDPEIVETAALAHDLGHPPFGHIAEQELDRLVLTNQAGMGFDGFEGNAQSFRIVTKLAVRQHESRGLNLTRASLCAMQKYPWFRASEGDRSKKWGAFLSEEEDFRWAREICAVGDDRKTLEAELMDWADDIAYAVHDMEDFYRAGLIPLHLLSLYPREREQFLAKVMPRLKERANRKDYGVDDLTDAFDKLLSTLPVEEPYAGTRKQRAALRSCTGNLIRRYVMHGIKVNEDFATTAKPVVVDGQYEMEIFLLKELTRHYVIDNPRLATQQYGKAKVIRGLFDVLCNAATPSSAVGKRWRDILPPRCREELEYSELQEISIPRLIADVVSSLSDREALMLYRRFLGTEPGSALDALVI